MTSDDEWKKKLDPERYYILRQAGTERPFTGEYNEHFEAGGYYCAGCDERLFDSDAKFASSCGWPAFGRSIEDKVSRHDDFSYGHRIEVRCANCDGHLGHVFTDGPRKFDHTRYCINSLALQFRPERRPKEQS